MTVTADNCDFENIQIPARHEATSSGQLYDGGRLFPPGTAYEKRIAQLPE